LKSGSSESLALACPGCILFPPRGSKAPSRRFGPQARNSHQRNLPAVSSDFGSTTKKDSWQISTLYGRPLARRGFANVSRIARCKLGCRRCARKVIPKGKPVGWCAPKRGQERPGSPSCGRHSCTARPSAHAEWKAPGAPARVHTIPPRVRRSRSAVRRL